VLKVRLNDKGVDGTKLDITQRMTGLLCADLQVMCYSENKVAILYSVHHYVTFV
jgi:hypothetical protein